MKKILIAIAGGSLFFMACKKSSPGNDPGGNGSGELLKTFALVAYNPATGGKLDSMTTDYTYDAQKRLVSQIEKSYDFSTNAAGDLTIDTATESYTSGLITEIQQSWKGGLHLQTITTNYHLNAAGKQPDSSDQVIVNYVSPGTITDFSTYTFDGNGYLTSQKVYALQNGQQDLATEIACTVANGNPTSTIITVYIVPGNTSPSITTKSDFSYSNQTPSNAMIASLGDPNNNIVGIASNGINLMRSPANLIQSVTTSLSGNVVQTETVTYTFDSQNRVTTITYKGDTGNLIAMAYYTY